MNNRPRMNDNIALCLWGGRTPGKRPSTKLALIEIQYGTELEVTFIRDDKARTAKDKYYKHARKVPLSDVVYSWPDMPSKKEIRRVKALYLNPCEEQTNE